MSHDRVYIFQADIYCEVCGEQIRGRLVEAGKGPKNQDEEDYATSDDWPIEGQNGEADTPQHCADCHVFLENPLTEDGVDYLLGVNHSTAGEADDIGDQLHYYGFHNRAKVFEDYSIRHGVISSPGKFEAEYLWAPYIYGLMMDGLADETIYDRDTPIDIFKAPFPSDFPELREAEYIICYEDDNGFLYCAEKSQAEIDDLCAALDAQDEEDDEDTENPTESSTSPLVAFRGADQ